METRTLLFAAIAVLVAIIFLAYAYRGAQIESVPEATQQTRQPAKQPETPRPPEQPKTQQPAEPSPQPPAKEKPEQ